MPFLRPRRFPLFLFLAAAVPTRLPAQLPPLTVPKGQVRFDLGGRFAFWDQAYVAGAKQSLAADLIRDPLTSPWVPGLAEAETALRQATGAQGLSLSLGKSSANLSVNVGTAEIGAALGVTSWLTVFGRVPIVRVRVLQQLALDSAGATAGFNPADPLFGTAEGMATTSGFMSELESALATLDARIRSGQYDADPTRRAEAEALLARGRSLQSALGSLLGSAFLPLAGGAPALALGQSIDSVRSRLLAVDSIPLTAAPALPSAGLLPGGLEDFATRAGGPIGAQPFEPPILRSIGDIEVGLGLALLNGKPPLRSGGIAVRSALQGTIRLPTGKLDDPNSFFDLGSGDRQLDIQGDLVTDIMTSWAGARLSARYVVQRPHRFERRITPPDQPIAPAATLALVERDPGEIIEGAFEPYVRFARHFSFVAGARYWSKAEDRYTYAPGQDSIPGATPAVLAQGSKENGTMLSAGFSFSHGGPRQDGRPGLPLDAFLRGQMVLGSTEGRVPVKQAVVFEMRVYAKLW